nr:MAG TPA: hypothetical protein [Bacteriophage sp.]
MTITIYCDNIQVSTKQQHISFRKFFSRNLKKLLTITTHCDKI